jgi:hypothetical protein
MVEREDALGTMSRHSYSRIPNWPHLRARYQAYWDRRVPDRRIIAHIQNINPHPPAAEPWMLDAGPDKYLDPHKLFRLLEWRRTAWRWHSDLFPYCGAAYDPAVFAGFCGARPAFGRDTVWHDPVISSLDEADAIHFDEDNPYWKRHLETVAYFAERCHGVQMLGVTDLGGPSDWIALLMGTENSLLASIERPDDMRAFAVRLAEESNRAYDLSTRLIAPTMDGYVRT